MNTKLEQLKSKLETAGIKPTYIRLRILEYLEKNKIHPTAEIIYEELLNEIPTISKMSVYNTLNMFSEKGVSLHLVISGTEARFDGNTVPHHHFLCEKCGKIIDLDIECRYFKTGSILGHQIKELHGYFKGICSNCRKDAEKK
jgi:Fur family peroxide stress response transcriptional regulator